MKKLFVLFLLVFIFCACTSTQKQEEPKQSETGFTMSQEELEKWFPPIDTSQFGHCTRCGLVENGHIRK